MNNNKVAWKMIKYLTLVFVKKRKAKEQQQEKQILDK
jgi:hypothetical protein